MRKYTFADIARMLSRVNTGNFITEDRIKSWVNQGYLNAERVPDYVESWGKYPYWIQEPELKQFLRAKGYDVDSIFPCE
jgi:hypothetical protein